MILGASLLGCERKDDPPTQPPPAQATQPATLPRIDLTGLRELIEECSRSKRILVIDFWATWCGPCVEIFGDLHRGLSGLGGRVRVVTVSLDSPGQYESKAVAFLREHNAVQDAYLLAPDQDARVEVVRGLGRQWQDLVVPAILVFGVEGRLEREFVGEHPVGTMINAVERLLAAGPSAGDGNAR